MSFSLKTTAQREDYSTGCRNGLGSLTTIKNFEYCTVL